MRPVAATVVVAGPDGAGKTTVGAELLSTVLAGPALHLHHRPRVLPARTTHTGPVTEPHRHPPYPAWVSALKLLYLFVDYWLGWWTRIRPVRRRGGSVLLERGWWDLVIDPRRYRMQPPGWLLRALSRLAPKPDLTVVLIGDPGVLHTRKAELPIEELDRQVRSWQRLAATRPDALVVDATAPLAELVEAVRHRLAGSAEDT